jgi:predicted kinase
MEENILIMTVGLPRSGKSTWAKDAAKEYGCPVVNRDAVRLALHGNRFINAAEDMVAAVTKYMVKALFIAGHNHVILDECNVSEKRRVEWMKGPWRIMYKVFDVPADVCKQRAIETEQEDLIPIIDRMAEEWDFVPSKEAMIDGQ